MATRLFLVRHGSTTLTAEDRFAGESDVPLSGGGREEAAALAERLSSERIAAIFASPMSRTRDTAAILAAPHRLEIQIEPALREIAHGHWEGMARADVEKEFSEEYAKWERDPYTYAPPGGETGLSVTSRALPALLGIAERHENQQVVVVSHKATIRLLLTSLLGFEPRTYRDRLDMSPASLSIVDFRDPTRARLVLFNDTSHHSKKKSEVPDMSRKRLSSWFE